ncbi:MAG: DMT family transporter [Rhodospirillales bacterium]|nr:DMT family transporter [Rhodospirillales bacterium]
MTGEAALLPRARERLDAGAAATMVLLCALWGFNQIAVKVANTGISPVLQGGLRSIGATLLVLLWARARGVRFGGRDETLVPGVAAGLLFAVEFALLYWGLAFTTASRGVVFLYTTPFIVAIGAHFFVPGDRLTRTKALGLAAAFAGLALAFADSLRLPSQRELLGDLLCLGAAVLWGATTVLIKASPLVRAPPEKTLLYQLGVSALAMPIGSALIGEPGIVAPTGAVLAALAYQTVIVAFASYVAWFWLVAHYPASRLAAFSFLAPVFGVFFGATLLGEAVGPPLLLAVALIAAGIWLVNRPPGDRSRA